MLYPPELRGLEAQNVHVRRFASFFDQTLSYRDSSTSAREEMTRTEYYQTTTVWQTGEGSHCGRCSHALTICGQPIRQQTQTFASLVQDVRL